MELPIERWAADQRLPDEAVTALHEASVCFRAGAYRAALLFSYVTWGLVVRSRILAANCPPGLPAATWTSIQAAVQNDDRWDVTVFDTTQQKAPVPVFNVTDDLRAQVRFWKDRRNDCAHSKGNSITAAHVEALWEFLRSNLAKFVPGGSVEDLLARIRDHFDPNLTPAGAPCDQLVAQIDSAVSVADRPAFFAKVVKLFERKVGTKTLRRTRPLAAFFETALRAGPPTVETALRSFLVGRFDLLAPVLRHEPKWVSILAGEPKLVRQLWREKLEAGEPADLRIYAALLRNRLVPDGEKGEANELLVFRGLGVPADEDVTTLETAGFFEAFRKAAFEDGKIDGFDWGNRNAELLAWWLGRFDWSKDDQVVTQLCDTFGAGHYPYDAQEALQAFFASDRAERTAFRRACKRLGKTPPAVLVEKPAEPGSA